MSIDTLTNHPEFMSAWTKMAATKKFFEYLGEERVITVEKLRDATDPYECARLQGDLKRLDKILKLPNELERVVGSKQQTKK